MSKMEINSPNMMSSSAVNSPLLTGTLIMDCLIPIGLGQRELMIGDRNTGKTSLAITTIISQVKNNSINPINMYGSYRLFCIYVGCGIKKSQIFNMQTMLKEFGAMWYSIMISAPSSLSASMQYLSPFYGCAIGEYFSDNSLNALLIYDDLTNQAYAYRQMSLIMGKAPGSEAYSGDMFYLHSRLLERAAKLSKKFGFGSLVVLPIIETQEENISAYIPTNVISITDGQIYLSKNLFKNGILPAIDLNKSISSIGAKAQILAMSKISFNLKNIFSNYFNIINLKQTGQILNTEQKYQYNLGGASLGLWQQEEFMVMDSHIQYMLNYALNNNFLCSKNSKLCMYLMKKLFARKQHLFMLLVIINSNNYDMLKFINFTINKMLSSNRDN